MIRECDREIMNLDIDNEASTIFSDKTIQKSDNNDKWIYNLHSE